MSAELDIQSAVARTNSGTYFVPFSKVIELSQFELDEIEKAFRKVIEANPDYEFETYRDDFNYGTIIRWRKIK